MKRIFLLLALMAFSWNAKAQQTVGLFLNDEDSFNGYTLFAPNSFFATFLIDNCGYLVNSWQSNYNPGVSAYLLENGNLLRTARVASSTFNGGGIGGRLELFNWDGDIIWELDYANSQYHQHHDVEYLPNGNILLIAWEHIGQQEAIQAGRDPDKLSPAGVWPDKVVEIKPMGADQAEVVWEWHAIHHLIQDYDGSKANFGDVDQHPELINFNYTLGNNPDWLHCNSVSYNEELDQIVLSSRHFDEIWIIDHSTTTAEAAGQTGGNSGMGGDLLYRYGNPQTYGRGTDADQVFFGQHDARWIPEGYPGEGQIMVFNNGAGRPQGAYSSVDIIEPPLESNGLYTINNGEAFGPENLFWSYVANPPGSMYSQNISGAHPLPNGNTLICDGNAGDFREVSPQKQIVWRYVSPVNQFGPVTQFNNPGVNSVFRCTRYAADYPAFIGKDLPGGNPIEINPIDYECEIFLEPVSTSNVDDALGVEVVNTLVDDVLYVNNPSAEPFIFELFSIGGQKLVHKKTGENEIYLNLSNITPGLYILKISNDNFALFKTYKIIIR